MLACTDIACEPNGFMAALRNRMPVTPSAFRYQTQQARNVA